MGNRIKALFFAFLFISSTSAFAAEQVFFYHTDPAGTPLAMTDTSGNVVWRADYKPFGEENTVAESQENDKRFVGKEKDEETGHYYFGARYMDPKTGRFVAIDPVRAVDPRSSKTNENLLLNPQGLNPYAYSLNNPYRYVDPDGKNPVLIALGVFLIGEMIQPQTMGSPVRDSFIDRHAGDMILIGGMLEGIPMTRGMLGEKEGGRTSIQKILEGASPEKMGKTKQFSKGGGLDQANRDFESLVGNSPTKEYPTGVRSANLPDGSSVSVRPFSSGDKPTLQINPSQGKTIKVRYE